MFTRRRVLFAVLAVTLGALAAGTWYVCTKGFARSWRTMLAAEFEKQGIELSLRRLTLDPFRGLVAQEVRLLDARDRRRVLAVIDEMEVGVNYAAMLRGESALDFINLRDAHLTLPLDAAHADTTTVEISKLNARVFLPPHQLYLARAEAEVFGVQVYASGRLINPQAYAGTSPSGHPLVGRAGAVIALLSSLKYRAAPPVLSVEFSGDLEHPEEIAVDARFYAENVKRANYNLNQVSAIASFRSGILELHQLGAADGKGELRGSATYHPRTGKITARVQSSLAMHDFLRTYVPEMRLPTNLKITSPPRLDLTLEGVVAHRYDWSIFGHVALEHFEFFSVPVRSVVTDLSWSGGRWSLRDLHLQHHSGEIWGEAIEVPGDFRAALHGSINPRAFAPLLHTALGEWLGHFDFVDSPEIELSVRGTAPRLEECAATGKIEFGRGLYDGKPAQHFTSQVRFAEDALSLSPFRIPAEGEEPEDLIFDLRKKEVRIEKTHTSAVSTPEPHGKS